MEDLEIKQKTADATTNLALDTINKKKQGLVFVSSKRGAEKQAEGIAKALNKSEKGIVLGERILRVISRSTKQCKRLGFCSERGIAFHHSGLHPKQRQIVEDAFRKGEIKIICATPTLAAGLDLPAFRVILRDTKRYAERHGMAPIPVLEYLQMIGRGGRPKFDSYGEGICIVKNEEGRDEIYERYIHGEPENIQSKLAVEPVLRTYLLSLIASGVISSKKEIVEFFKETFWAYQYQDMEDLVFKIEKILEMLVNWSFLEKKGGGEFVSADELDKELYRATRLGKRVSELYLDPLTAYEFIECLEKTKRLKVLKPISFLHMISNALEIRPMLKVRVKEFDHYQEKSGFYQPYLLRSEPSVYEHEFEGHLQSLKTAMMFEEWIDEVNEDQLMEKYGTTPGELHTKLEIANWLLYTAVEIADIKGWKSIKNPINKVRFQIRYGVREELLPLVKIKNIGRMRARILYKNKVKDLRGLRNIDLNKLALLVGAKVAMNLKKEIGEKIVEPIKIKKQGQTSLTRKWQK